MLFYFVNITYLLCSVILDYFTLFLFAFSPFTPFSPLLFYIIS